MIAAATMPSARHAGAWAAVRVRVAQAFDRLAKRRLERDYDRLVQALNETAERMHDMDYKQAWAHLTAVVDLIEDDVRRLTGG